MSLKKVAPTFAWSKRKGDASGLRQGVGTVMPTRRKGARPGRVMIVASGPDYVVATSGVAAAWFDISTGDAVFTTSEPAAAAKARILRVGSVTYFRV